MLVAIDDSNTIITTAKRSSTMSTASTCEANFFCRSPRSVKALRMIVVDDIDSMPPKKSELMLLKPIRRPMAKPQQVMPQMMIRAVTIAEAPELTSFLKLNSRPSEKRSTTMPICAQKSMLASVVTDGSSVKCGLARNPATI